MPPWVSLGILFLLLLASPTRGNTSTRDCLSNSGFAGPDQNTSASEQCDCSAVGDSTVCVSELCHCTGGTCAGTDGKCHAGGNTQVGGPGQIYRIRNARWPNWYLEMEQSTGALWVRKGRKRAEAKTYQWALMMPPNTSGSHYFMFSEFRPDHALVYGSRRTCTAVDDGEEVLLEDDSSTNTDGLGLARDEEPGPDGFPVEGLGLNGEPLEPVVENETARQLELMEREDDDIDGDTDGDWFEDTEEGELLKEMVHREEASYRSRVGAYYSRSRASLAARRSGSRRRRRRRRVGSRRRSGSRSRGGSFYSRSRSYHSYHSTLRRRFGATATRRRRYAIKVGGPSYCRDLIVPNAIKVSGTQMAPDLLAMKFTKAPMASTSSAAALLMISSVTSPDHFLFVPRFTSGVSVFNGDPGAGGYWFFDPPLPSTDVAKVSAHVGAKCSSNCGSVGSIDDLGITFVNEAPKVQLPTLLFCFMVIGQALAFRT